MNNKCSNNMKILHMIYCMGIGGAQTMLVDIMNEQCKNDEVHLIVINNYYSDDLLNEINNKVHVHKINRPQGSRNLYYILKLNLLLLKINPDIIHSHDASIIKLLLINAPKIITIHDTGLDTTSLRKYNSVVSISDAVYQDLKQRANIDSTIIENGIVVKNISFRKFALETPRNRPFRIVQVSRLSLPKKGQDIIIRAVSLLIKKQYDIELTFIGDGESRKELEKLTEDENISSNVRFLGMQNRDYIYSELCKYDLFVQPSRNEGFGLTVAEAVASGIPVLVSDIEGPMEIIEKGKYGFYFKNGNVQSCANTIEFILNNVTTINSNNNRQHIFELYDIKNTVEQYKAVYKKLLI